LQNIPGNCRIDLPVVRTLKMEVAGSSKMLLSFNHITRRQIKKKTKIITAPHPENPKSHYLNRFQC